MSAGTQGTSKVTYKGEAPLTFGFQAVQLFYENMKYTTFKPLEPGAGLRALERSPDDGATRLTVDSPFVRLGGE